MYDANRVFRRLHLYVLCYLVTFVVKDASQFTTPDKIKWKK